MKKVTDKQYWMDQYLASNLDTGIYNLQRDFDLIGTISGSGQVRIGKSALAQQVGYYCAYELNTPFSIKNIVFSGDELIKTANELPKNSVIIYDEARGELDNKKVMENVTKSLLDFFSECGYLNQIFILVLPDFFELPKGIAINRSDFLINVFRTSSETKNKKGNMVMRFDRGKYQFFNRERKKKLYIDGKKQYNDYGLGKHNFYGDFPNYFIIPQDEYEAKKILYARRDRTKQKQDARLPIVLKVLCSLISQREAAKMLQDKGLNITQQRICQIINSISSNSLENDAMTNDK